MIQRIQSVYLLLVTILLIVAMCLPVGAFITAEDSLLEFTNLKVSSETVTDSSVWGLFAILLLSALIAFATILLYRNRMLQIRMSIFNSILLVGYYIAYVTFIFILQSRFDTSYQLKWGVCLPLICLILNYLAIRAIGKDEVLVKAADRLR